MAAESCMVLSDPLHFLYSKVNKFLNKGPVWKVEKLPSYWVDGILMRLPTMDDVYYKEMEWLLNVLIEGLRTSVVSNMLSLKAIRIQEGLTSADRIWNSIGAAMFWNGSFAS